MCGARWWAKILLRDGASSQPAWKGEGQPGPGEESGALGFLWDGDLSLWNLRVLMCSLFSPQDLCPPYSGASDCFLWPWVGFWLCWHLPRRPRHSLGIIIITAPSHVCIMLLYPHSPFTWNPKQTTKKDILIDEPSPGLQATSAQTSEDRPSTSSSGRLLTAFHCVCCTWHIIGAQ